MRALIGREIFALDLKPRRRTALASAIRPLPVRVVMTTKTPFSSGISDAFVLRSARRARAGGGDDDALRALIDDGLDDVARRALIGHHDVDARQFLDPATRRTRSCRRGA